MEKYEFKAKSSYGLSTAKEQEHRISFFCNNPILSKTTYLIGIFLIQEVVRANIVFFSGSMKNLFIKCCFKELLRFLRP